MTNWYQEGSIIDAIRGGEVKSGINIIDDSLNNLIKGARRNALKSDAAKGYGGKDDFGDVKTVNPLTNIFGFTEKEAVGAQQEVVDQNTITNFKDTAALYGYSLTNKDGSVKSAEEVKSFLNEREKVKDLIGGSGFDATDLKLDPNKASLASVGSAIRRRRAEEAAKLRKPGERIAERQITLAEDNAESLSELRAAQLKGQEADREYRQWKDGQDDKFRKHQLEVAQIEKQNARAERLAESKANREDKRYALEMQIAQNGLDRAYQRERDERADARTDKLQRQQSIMTLVKGLTQLSAGFSL